MLLGAYHHVDPSKVQSFLLKRNICPPKSLLKLVINPSSQKQCHCKHRLPSNYHKQVFFFFPVIVKRVYFECVLFFVFKVQHNILLVVLWPVGRMLNCGSDAAVTNWAAVG